MLTIYCPHCQSKLKAPEKLIGRQLPCPKCQGKVQVTAPSRNEPGKLDEPVKPPASPSAKPQPSKPQPSKPQIAAAAPKLPSTLPTQRVVAKPVAAGQSDLHPTASQKPAPTIVPSNPVVPKPVEITELDDVEVVDDVETVDEVETVDDVDVVGDVDVVDDVTMPFDPLAHDPLAAFAASDVATTSGATSQGTGFWQAPVVEVPVASKSQRAAAERSEDNSSSMPPLPVLIGLGVGGLVAVGLILMAVVWSFSGSSEPVETLANNPSTAAEPEPGEPAANPTSDTSSKVDTLQTDSGANPNKIAAEPKAKFVPSRPKPVSLSIDVMDAIPLPERVGPGISITLAGANGGAQKGATANKSILGAPEPVQAGVVRLRTNSGVRCSLSHDGSQVAIWTLYNPLSNENQNDPKMFRIVDAHTGEGLADLAPRGMVGVILSKHKIYGLEYGGRALHCWNRQTFQFEQTKRLDLEALSIDNVMDKWLAIAYATGILYLDIDTLEFTPQSRMASEDLQVVGDVRSAYVQTPAGILTGNILWNPELTRPLNKLMPYHTGMLMIGSERPTLSFDRGVSIGRYQEKWRNGRRDLEGEPRLASGGKVSLAIANDNYEFTIKGDTSVEKVSIPIAADVDKAFLNTGDLELLAARDAIVAHTYHDVFLLTPSALGPRMPTGAREVLIPQLRIENPYLDPNQPTQLKIIAENIPKVATFEFRLPSQSPLPTGPSLVTKIDDDTFEISSQLFLDPQRSQWPTRFMRIVAESQLDDPELIYDWYIEKINKELATLEAEPIDEFVVAIIVDLVATYESGNAVSRPCVYLPVPRDRALDILTAALQFPKQESNPPAGLPEPFAGTSIVEIANRTKRAVPDIRKRVTQSLRVLRKEPLMMTLPQLHETSPGGPLRTWHVFTREGEHVQMEAKAQVHLGDLLLARDGVEHGERIQPLQLSRQELQTAVTDVLDQLAPIPTRVDASPGSSQMPTNDSIRRRAYAPKFGSALTSFVRDFNCLPPSALADDAGKPLLSWRVMLLPYLGYDELYLQFHLDEPWDSPHNRELIPFMPACYLTKDAGLPRGMTKLLALTGEHTAMPGNRLVNLTELNPALTSRIMCVVAKNELAVPWTKPVDFVMDVEGPPVAGWMVQRQGDTDRFTAVTGAGDYVSLELNAANLAACYWDDVNPQVAFDAKAASREKPKPVLVFKAPGGAMLPAFDVEEMQDLVVLGRSVFLKQAFDPDQQVIALTGRVANQLMVLNVSNTQEFKGKQLNLNGVLTSLCLATTKETKYFVVGISQPNRLILIDTKTLEAAATFELGEYWARDLRAPVGEPTPHVYAVARAGDYTQPSSDYSLLRINLQSGKVEKTWEDFEVYDDLTAFRRDNVDWVNFAQMNEGSARNSIAMPLAIDKLQNRNMHYFPYGGNSDPLTMFPFPASNVSIWGDSIFTLDMKRLKQQMVFHPAAYLEGTPWVIGILEDQLLIGSVNDGRLVARMPRPTKRPTTSFELKKQVQSHMPGIFWSPTTQTFFLVDRNYLSPVKLSDLGLPDEPCLLLKTEPADTCSPGKEYRCHVTPIKAKVYRTKLLEAPPGASLQGLLSWTPPSDFAGKAKFTVRITANDVSHDESWVVEVQ